MKPGDLVMWVLPETQGRVYDIGLLLEIYGPDTEEIWTAPVEAKVLFSYGEDIIDLMNCTVLSTTEEEK
jgi:hypothetical protein